MKILHINVSPTGGAGWCATRINNALVKAGVDSKMLFCEGKNLPDGVEGDIVTRDPSWTDRYRFLQKGLRGLAQLFPCFPSVYSRRIALERAIAKSGEKIIAHLPFSEFKNIVTHPLVGESDIIHLHWVSEFVDYPTFFRRVKKPIVWTLHDMHPVLGVMHFESEWTRRPAALDGIDARYKKIKQASVSRADIHTVAISQMMKGLVTSSEILGGHPCEMIHNGVDVDVFKPCEGHPHEGVTFLFSSHEIFDRRKGLVRIVEALESLDLPSVTLLCVGQNRNARLLPKSRIKIRHLGFIADSELMSRIYSEADCFINASYEEAFSQTPLESMACGTPVVSTPCSGAADLIRDFNGVVCEGFTPAHLAAGIRTFLSRRYDSEAIRQHIVANYSYDKIARQYRSLYERILGR